jgi:hypothetical protein
MLIPNTLCSQTQQYHSRPAFRRTNRLNRPPVLAPAGGRPIPEECPARLLTVRQHKAGACESLNLAPRVHKVDFGVRLVPCSPKVKVCLASEWFRAILKSKCVDNFVSLLTLAKLKHNLRISPLRSTGNGGLIQTIATTSHVGSCPVASDNTVQQVGGSNPSGVFLRTNPSTSRRPVVPTYITISTYF